MERRHGLETALLGQHHRVLARGLEVDTVFDQLGSERTHRRVLVGTVAVRRDDRHRHAGCSTGERQALAMVAASGADDPTHLRPLAHEPIDVDQPAAHLERAGRRAVLVLQPDLGADLCTQQWPGELRRRSDVAGDDLGSVGELVERE